MELLFVLTQGLNFFLDWLVIHVDILDVCEAALSGFLAMGVLVIDVNSWCHFDVLTWGRNLLLLLLVRFASLGIILIFDTLVLIVEGFLVVTSHISDCIDYFIDLFLVDVQVGLIE